MSYEKKYLKYKKKYLSLSEQTGGIWDPTTKTYTAENNDKIIWITEKTTNNKRNYDGPSVKVYIEGDKNVVDATVIEPEKSAELNEYNEYNRNV